MPESTSPIDGIAPASATQAPIEKTTGQEAAVKRWKFFIVSVWSIACVIFVLWDALLMVVLPTGEESMQPLVMVGIGTNVIAIAVFVIVGLSLLFHISGTKAGVQARKIALLKLFLIVTPGIALGVLTPFMILREPALTIDVLDPVSTDDIVAPLSITFSVAKAQSILQERGFTPVKYQWDINGDAKVESETFGPELTVDYDRAGDYIISVTMSDAARITKKVQRRLIISTSVFSVTPTEPIIGKPAVFSVEHLFTDPKVLTSAEWDFDGDGKIDETVTSTNVSYTYFRIGSYKPSVRVHLADNTQYDFQREVMVKEPPVLPFQVEIVSDPENLVGTAPFTALFNIESPEDIAQVQWSFGDGMKDEGMRVAHTFTKDGSFSVAARVHTQSGTLAEISTVVDVVKQLNLSDLKFEGTPKIENNRIEGETPLKIDITPVTAKSFVEFIWEAPGATEIGSTEGALQAIYRREGNYTVTLVARDAEKKVLRLPITVVVKPLSSLLDFQINPQEGVAPLTVKFDASETSVPGDDITGFIWSFGDSQAKEYGGAFTQHIYPVAGTYVVDLTVRTAAGKQLNTTKTIVVRAPILQACILPSRLSGEAPLGVEFTTGCSTGEVASTLWDFGDGSESDEAEPIHVFERAGTYKVTVTIKDAFGATSTSSVTINAR